MKILTKKCSKCQKHKFLRDFSKGTGRGGVQNKCKSCQSKHTSNYRKGILYEKVREKSIWYHPVEARDGVGPFDAHELASYLNEHLQIEDSSNLIIKIQATQKLHRFHILGWVVDKSLLPKLWLVEGKWVKSNKKPQKLRELDKIEANRLKIEVRNIKLLGDKANKTKHCIACDQTLPLLDFHINHKGHTHNTCKQCKKIQWKKNKPQIIEYVIDKMTKEKYERPTPVNGIDITDISLPQPRKSTTITRKKHKFMSHKQLLRIENNIFNDINPYHKTGL